MDRRGPRNLYPVRTAYFLFDDTTVLCIYQALQVRLSTCFCIVEILFVFVFCVKALLLLFQLKSPATLRTAMLTLHGFNI